MMTSDEDGTLLESIKNGLRPLFTDEALLDKLSSDIRKELRFLNWKPPPGSHFFAFEDRVNQVVDHFAGDGLTRRDYLRVAVREPTLFVLKPETMIDNVEGVIAHFAVDGLTRRDYIRAAIRRPSLFGLTSKRVIHNVESLVDHFARDGLIVRNYVQAVLKLPSLFCRKPESIISNVEGVVSYFAPDGLSTQDYLRALCDQPARFNETPDKVIRRIEGVTGHFAADGLTRRDYLRAAVSHPGLFGHNPDTIIRHVNLLTELHREGKLDLSRARPGTRTGAGPVWDMIMTNPIILSLADDSFLLREIHAAVTDNKLSPSRMKKSRASIERECFERLGHPDPRAPVPNVETTADAGKHARNLLLRALVREGIVKGRLS
jgi:hypothetical protein